MIPSPLQYGFFQKPLSAFNPGNLFRTNDLGDWYNLYDFSKMSQNSAGTIPVTATGQTVGRLIGQRGLVTIANSNAARRPILQADGGGRYYLAWDGVDDCLFTQANYDMSTTDEVTAVVGMTSEKAAGTVGTLLELSTTVVSTDGSFLLAAPTTAGTVRYGAASRGTTTVSGTDVVAYSPPMSAVAAMQAKIAAPYVRGYVNNTQVFNVTTSQGTGNYSNNLVFFGARGNGADRFGGRLYSGFGFIGRIITADALRQWNQYVNRAMGTIY